MKQTTRIKSNHPYKTYIGSVDLSSYYESDESCQDNVQDDQQLPSNIQALPEYDYKKCWFEQDN